MGLSLSIGSNIASSIKPGGVPIVYLLRDDFTTPGALSSPHACEPGPGTLTLFESSGDLSNASGRMHVNSTASAWGGLGFHDATVRTRTPGLVMFARNYQAPDNYHVFGFFNGGGIAQTNLLNRANVYFRQTNNIAVLPPSGAILNIGTYTVGQTYDIAVVLDNARNYSLIKGGSEYPEWTILYISVDNTTSVYPGFTSHNADNDIEYFYASQLGPPWDTDFGIATTVYPGIVPTYTVLTTPPDSFQRWYIDTMPTSGSWVQQVRAVDNSNFWDLQVSASGRLYLYEVIAGSYTMRASTGIILSADSKIIVICKGTVIRAWVDGSLVINYTNAVNFQEGTYTRPGWSSGLIGKMRDFECYSLTPSSEALTELERYTT